VLTDESEIKGKDNVQEVAGFSIRSISQGQRFYPRQKNS